MNILREAVTITGERERHAVRAGAAVETQPLLSPSGQPVGGDRQRIMTPLALMYRRGAIDLRQHYAAQRFAWLADRLRAAQAPVTAGYEVRGDSSAVRLQPIELRIHRAQILVRIRHRVPKRLHAVLEWIVEGNELGQPLEILSLHYWPALSKTVRMNKVYAYVELTCDCLADYFECNSLAHMDDYINAEE